MASNLRSDKATFTDHKNASIVFCSLSILRDGLVDPDIILAVHAAEGLVEIGQSKEVLTVFTSRFIEEHDARNRCLLARELIRAGDLKRLSFFLTVLNDADEMLQIVVAESLFKVRQLGDEHLLRGISDRTRNSKLRLFISAALAAHGDGECFERIKMYLSNADAEIRKIAVWLLARLGTSADAGLIKMYLITEQNEVLRAYANHTLAVFGDENGIKHLQSDLISNNAEIRRTAADIARLVKTSADLSRALERALTDMDGDVRIRVAHAILSRVCHDQIGPTS